MAGYAAAFLGSAAFIGGAYYLDWKGKTDPEYYHPGKYVDPYHRIYDKKTGHYLYPIQVDESKYEMKPPTSKRGRVYYPEIMPNKRPRTEQFEETDHVATVHHSSTKYGRPAKKNLKNAWRYLTADTKQIWCRYQSIATNGFRDGLGTFRLTYDTFQPNTLIGSAKIAAPLYAFELNCLPRGFMRTGDDGNVNKVIPYVGTRLVLDDNGVGGWHHATVESFEKNNSANIANTYDITKQDVDPMHYKFQHNWSDIRLTLYPQTSLPGKIKVSLVKFNETDLYTWPAARGLSIDSSDVTNDYFHYFYDATGDSVNEIEDNVTTWREYLHGKNLHPNFKPEKLGGKSKSPFTVLRQEIIDMPARDGPGNGTYRVVKKLFFRNDRVYNVTNPETRLMNPSATLYGSYAPGDIQATGISSVWTKNEDRIFLLVEGVPYWTQNTSPTSTITSGMLSFDVVIRNKFTVRDADIAILHGVSNAVPTEDMAAGPAEELLEVIPEEAPTEEV